MNPAAHRLLNLLVVLLFLEHGRHVSGGLLEGIRLRVGVDIGCGLIVAVANHLHGDEWVYAALIEQSHVVVPEAVRGSAPNWPLEDVGGPADTLVDLAFHHAAGIPHQARPDAPETVLRQRLELVVMESVLRRRCWICRRD